MFDNSKIEAFDWGDLNYFELGLNIGIRSFRSLNMNIEESLTTNRNKFQQALKSDETLNSLETDVKAGYYSQFFEGIELTLDELQRQQRYSICLSIISFFEGQLELITDLTGRQFCVKFKKIKGKSDLYNYWNYFENILKISTDKIQPYFNFIESQKEARNRIAHHSGFIAKNKADTIKIGFGLSLRAFGEKYQIEITDKLYAEHLLSSIEAFFKELLIDINKRYNYTHQQLARD
jgi:hypothetical protein